MYEEICAKSFGYPFCQFNEPRDLSEFHALEFGIEEDECNFTAHGEAGIIRSPLFGESHYLPDTNCIYSIPVPPDKFLKLEITDFDIGQPNRYIFNNCPKRQYLKTNKRKNENKKE